MSAALPMIEQVLTLAPAPIVFVAFAAVLTGSFNTRMALLTEAWGGNISNVAQKQAFLNSPETNIKDNIRKRHERYLRNVIFSTGLLHKHLQWIRAGANMVLISFLFFVTATMFHILKPYNIYLAYPATILLWIGMLLDVVAVLLIFIDLWTSYAHLNNENLLLYKIKRMIIADFKATGQLPADPSSVQLEEHKSDADEAALHDEVNDLVLKNAQYRSEVENEMNIQKALTMKNLQISTASPDVELSAKSGDVATKEDDEDSSSSQSSSNMDARNNAEKVQTLNGKKSASESKEGSNKNSSSVSSDSSSDHSKESKASGSSSNSSDSNTSSSESS